MDQVEERCPQVLRSMLEYLEPPDLGGCRLVNKAWNFEASHILQRNVTVDINSLTKLRRYCEKFQHSIHPISLRFQSFRFGSNLLYQESIEDEVLGLGQRERLRQLAEAFQSFREVSCDNVLSLFVLINPTLRSNIPRRAHSSMSFVFGQLSRMIYESFPKLSSFSLNLETNYLLPELPDTDLELNVEELNIDNLPWREMSLPKLKKITLKSQVSDICCKSMFSTFVQSLLSSATSLDTMTSLSCWSTFSTGTDGLLCGFSYLSSNLRCLIIKETLEDTDLRQITSHNFINLNILDLSIGENVTGDTLKELLLQYGHFLQRLFLRLIPRRNESLLYLGSHIPPPEIVMRQLELLHLERCSHSTIVWRNLPKLQKLVLCSCSNLTYEGSNSFALSPQNLQARPTGSLKTLEVNGFQSNDVAQTFRFTEPNQFAFLTTLSIGCVTSPQLSFIFEQSKLLRNLTISGCPGVNASTICGLPSSLLEAISPTGNLQRDSNTAVVDAMIRMAKTVGREGPYIGDLIGLQSLTLNADLSDSSVLFGIVQCEQLMRLTLSSFPQQFSWRARLILEHGLKHLEKMHIRIPE